MQVLSACLFASAALTAAASPPQVWSSSCNDPMWTACHGLSGACCPNKDGNMLACCEKTPVPGPTPAPHWGNSTTISKVGFPERSLSGRPVCGSQIVKKSLRNPHYLLPIIFGGYREKTCPARGFHRFEDEEVKEVRTIPFLPWFKRNLTVDVWSHEVNWVNTNLCTLGHCFWPLRKVLHDDVTKSVKASVGSLGTCARDTWTCLGEEQCSAAAKCIWPTIQTCGTEVVQLLQNRQSRATIQCIWDCAGAVGCVLAKCSKSAVKCIFDSQCRQETMCFPKAMVECSKPALQCLLSKSSLCRQNLQCFIEGSGRVLDATAGYTADTKLADVFTCAQTHCKRPVGPVLPHDSTIPKSSAFPMLPPPEKEDEEESTEGEEAQARTEVQTSGLRQLKCMKEQCKSEWTKWHEGSDFMAASSCPARVLQECGHGLWHCVFTQGQCYKDVRCLVDGFLGTKGVASGVMGALMTQITDPKARKFDESVHDCFASCTKRWSWKLPRSLCFLRNCRHGVSQCLHDPTCKEAVLGAGEVLSSCGKGFAANYRGNWQAHLAGECMLKMVDQCAGDVTELLRDTTAADLIKCTHDKCPVKEALESTNATTILV